jgi:hypothetical protein
MKTKKLRKQCKCLAYHVQKLELEQRIAELKSNADRRPFGFTISGKREGQGNG